MITENLYIQDYSYRYRIEQWRQLKSINNEVIQLSRNISQKRHTYHKVVESLNRAVAHLDTRVKQWSTSYESVSLSCTTLLMWVQGRNAH